MADDTSIAGRLSANEKSAARLSFFLAALFLILLAGLHFIEPEFDPSWRMISEYEIGRYGWLMQIAFGALAASCVSMFLAIKSHARSLGGRIGLALLLVAAAGMVLGALAVSDPITASPAEQTYHGRLHGLGALVGIPSLPIAAVLISLALRNQDPWLVNRGKILLAAHLTWISALAMVAMLFLFFSKNGGQFGPAVIIGWPNRLLIVTQAVWLMTLAWSTFARRTRESRAPIRE